MKEFKFREGFHAPKGITAEDVAKELDRIERVTGKLDAPTIVDMSKDESDLLHPFFEWDDSVAGQKYRETQASWVATSVRVVYEEHEEPLRISAKYANQERRQYLTMSTVLSDEDLIRSAQDELFRSFNGLKKSLDLFENTLKRFGRSAKKIERSKKYVDKAVAAASA